LTKTKKNLSPSKTEISVIKRKSKTVLGHEYNRMAEKLKVRKNIKFEAHEE
jgi:hypothetical protein